MSTVAFFNGVLYADTQVTETAIKNGGGYKAGDVIKISRTQKIVKLVDSPCSRLLLIGCVGAVQGQEDFLNWTNASRSADKNYTFCNSFTAFEYDGLVFTVWGIKPAGRKWRKIDQTWRYCKVNKFVITAEHNYNIIDRAYGNKLWGFIGSGSDYAAGYFEGDKDPIAAIKAAAKYDFNTNMIIESVDLFTSGLNVVYDPNNIKEEAQLEFDLK